MASDYDESVIVCAAEDTSSAKCGRPALCGLQSHRVTLKKLAVLQLDPRREAFAAQSTGKERISRYYYRSALYETLTSGGSCFSTYSASVMKVTTQKFMKLVNLLRKTDMDWKIVQHSV